MYKKMNDRGITYVEIIIAVALITFLLLGVYTFLVFTLNSLKRTESEYDAGYDARIVFIRMDDDIRKANAVNIGGIRHKAIEIINSGMGINVYTDVNNDGTMQIVQYIIDNNSLKRGEAELGHLPTDWMTLADKVNNVIDSVPAFSLNEYTVKIKLLVVDENGELSANPTSVTTSITVRSKGAMD